MDGRHDRPDGRALGLFGWLAVGYAALAVFVVAAEVLDVVAVELFRDPLELGGPADSHPWKGSFSVLGVFLWSAGAAVSLLAGAVLRAERRDPRRARFLLATGALFLVLGIDDGLLVHDHWAERVTPWNQSQPIVSAFLFGLIILWLVVFRDEIARTRYVVLALALAGFLTAELIDLGGEFDIRSDTANLVEEALEFAAIATFFVYAAGEAWRSLIGRNRPTSPTY